MLNMQIIVVYFSDYTNCQNYVPFARVCRKQPITATSAFTDRDNWYMSSGGSLYQRFSKERIVQLLKEFRIVYLTGPRQAGKSTLAMAIAREAGLAYHTLDDDALLLAARTDPQGLLSALPAPMVIDESTGTGIDSGRKTDFRRCRAYKKGVVSAHRFSGCVQISPNPRGLAGSYGQN
jgi:hypothetical protein